MSNPGNDMQRDFERDCRRAAISMTLKVAAVAAVLAALVCTLAGCAGAPAVAESAHGQPLDAVSYQAPAFTGNAAPCYRVTDRTSGSSWWILYMSDTNCTKPTWVVLPIGDEQAEE